MTSQSSQNVSARKAFPSRLKIQIALVLALVCIHCAEGFKYRSAASPASAMPLADPNVRVVPLIKTVTEDVSELGEGPYWDAENQVLYFVDATSGDFKRLDPKTRQVEKLSQGVLVSMIIPYQDEPNTFIGSRWNELLKINWTSQTTTVLATVNTEGRFNDAKCDPRGRLFIGTMVELPGGGVVPNAGNLYRLDGNNFTTVATGFSISNGMAWSNDANHTKLYFNDSEGRKIYVFDYDIETGTPSNKKVLIDCDQSSDFVAAEYPDGMAIDKFGYIWVAMYGGGRIVKIDVNTARVVDQVNLRPNVQVPSSLAPGPYEGNDGFFVTTAAIGIPQNERKDDGKILHISFQGGEVYKFKP